MWAPSLTDKVPLVFLLFSEYPSVVWRPIKRGKCSQQVHATFVRG